ncbi:MAG TPA: hypothetical protein VFR09_00530 [Alphaproteobacteria bacterium]|nr:hypothetical protein [Alphaproteobacteria bacterium]
MVGISSVAVAEMTAPSSEVDSDEALYSSAVDRDYDKSPDIIAALSAEVLGTVIGEAAGGAIVGMAELAAVETTTVARSLSGKDLDADAPDATATNDDDATSPADDFSAAARNTTEEAPSTAPQLGPWDDNFNSSALPPDSLGKRVAFELAGDALTRTITRALETVAGPIMSGPEVSSLWKTGEKAVASVRDFFSGKSQPSMQPVLAAAPSSDLV